VSASVIVRDYFSTTVEIKIDQQLEQRINIKFLVKLGNSGPEMCQMLQQAYGEDALKMSTVFKWVQRYREGRKDPTDNKRSGRPSTSRSDENIDRVHSLVLSDRRMTVQMIADELQIGKTSVYSILTEDLQMRKICTKIVPKLLIPEQKLRRKECCIDWKALEESGKCMLVLRERHLGDVAKITAESTTLIKDLKEDDFQGCFNQWKQRWDKCIASEWDKNYVCDNT
jgi:transposase